MAGVSLQCGDCGALLKSVEEAQEHAELTKLTNFSESTEPVLNLVSSTRGKPCRSKTESDLHTKRTGHAEFADKTSETVKPISLEAPKPKNDDVDMEDVGKGSSAGQQEEMVVPEVNEKLLADLEKMGFLKAKAARALHYSGNSSVEAAANWIVEHENDPDIDEMPLVPASKKAEASKPSLTPEEIKIKAQELREQKMEGEEEEKPFGSLLKLVEITASQEKKLQNCPFAKESDKFPETETDLSSLSVLSQNLPSPRPTPIIMVSLSDSEGSTDRNTQDKYHTPPEHSLSFASDSDPPPPPETIVLGGEDEQPMVVDLGEDEENPGLQLGGNLDDENSRRKRSSQPPTETTWSGGDVDGQLQLHEILEGVKGNEGGKQTAKSPATIVCGEDDLVAERAVDFGITEEALGYLGTQLDQSLCGERCDCVIRDHDREVLDSGTDTERVIKGEYCQNVAKKIRISEGDLRLGMCSPSSSDRTQRVEDLDTEIVGVDSEECHGNLGSDKQRLLITVGTVKKAIEEGVKLREKGEDCGWGNKGWNLLKNLHKTGSTGLDIRRNENLDSDGERSVWAGKGEKLGESDAKGRGICGEVENLCGNSAGKGDASGGRNLHLNGLTHGDHKRNGNLGSNGEGNGRNGKGKILGESGEAVDGYAKGERLGENGKAGGGYGKGKVLQENDDGGGGSHEGKNSCKNGRGNDGISRGERLRKNSDKVVKFREDNLDKNENGAGAAKALRKAVKAIEKFKYAHSCDDMKQRGKARGVLGKRELPLSMLGQTKGNPKEMESQNEGTKVRSFTDLLDSLKLVVRNADDGSEPDFLETAKRRGIVFPRPRWWSPERVD